MFSRNIPRVASIGLLSVLATVGAHPNPTAATAPIATSPSRGMASGKGNRHFDYLVIGAGSGGMASARRAASYGAKVAVVERSALGGTCVNVGCVPKKVMFNAGTLFEQIHEAHHHGITGVDGVRFDWAALKNSRDAYIRRLNGIYGSNLDKSEVTVVTGDASFVGDRTVAIDGDAGNTYTADHVLVAPGGYPVVPDIPGAREHCITSDGFFELERQPGKVAVVGAGYIAVELAGIFNALQSDTTLFVRGDRALRKFDSMIATRLDGLMRKAGIKVTPGSTPKAVERDAETGKLTLELENGERHEGFDEIVMAIGRAPSSASLNLAETGVHDIGRRGHISVDEYQNTAAEGVYALGDVCGKAELTPVAIAAGRRLADRLFGGMPTAKLDYEGIPTVVFSHPTIGTIGLTEEEAVAKHGADEVKVYTTNFVNLYYGPWYGGQAGDKPMTSAKLVCLGADERVVGLHIIGMASDEILQGFGVAMKMGATKADFDNCVAIHPTAAEELVTMAPWGLAPGNPAHPLATPTSKL